MATYEYSCDRCGTFDLRLPIGTADSTSRCPICEGIAKRVFSAPAFAVTGKAIASLHDQEERSREAPAMVSEVPSRGRTSQHTHPALSRLPRP
ncbi:zinc ribbon domain-containing protein [Streptomyces sp. NPDC102274]|uniref:FmdB family zinc ribbon protein n=1 Tax=Streptomyces sp. NPDC102274 TaxID=3366151 RepID=UPI0038199613